MVFRFADSATVFFKGFSFVKGNAYTAVLPQVADEFEQRGKELVEQFVPQARAHPDWVLTSDKGDFPALKAEQANWNVWPMAGGVLLQNEQTALVLRRIYTTNIVTPSGKQVRGEVEESVQHSLHYAASAADVDALISPRTAPVSAKWYSKGIWVGELHPERTDVVMGGKRFKIQSEAATHQGRVFERSGGAKRYLLTPLAGAAELYDLKNGQKVATEKGARLMRQDQVAGEALAWFSLPQLSAANQQGRQSESHDQLVGYDLATLRHTTRDGVPGVIEATSELMTKIVCRREHLFYLARFQPSENRYELTEIPLVTGGYKEAALSPNGRLLVLLDDTNRYALHDIVTDEVVHYFTGKFLGFQPSGTMMVETDRTRGARLLDPLTLKDVTPASYRYYRFLSPDGRLYAETSSFSEWYYKLDGRYVSDAACTELKQQMGFTANEGTNKEKRDNFFSRYAQQLAKLGIERSSEVDASALLVRHNFVKIGVVGSSHSVDVRLPDSMSYFNYGAFSFDSKWFGYAVKPFFGGIMGLQAITFDESTGRISLGARYEISAPGMACWTCGFSKAGYFASYDSTPNTFIVELTDTYWDRAHQTMVSKDTDASDVDEWKEEGPKSQTGERLLKRVKGKNILCFSPSGNYLALSTQGYDAISTGGFGHLKSGVAHVARTSDRDVFASFQLQESDGRYRTGKRDIGTAAFSAAEDKLMLIGTDGVVTVYNIDSLSPISDGQTFNNQRGQLTGTRSASLKAT
ncbi:MAG: hypothetical protein H7330_05210 [Hymenobacteraceae bacterium]|nr:hypothetical protein [Hymenobacteraceae bacterium]